MPFYCSTIVAESSIISVDCYEKRKAFICKLAKDKISFALDIELDIQNAKTQLITEAISSTITSTTLSTTTLTSNLDTNISTITTFYSTQPRLINNFSVIAYDDLSTNDFQMAKHMAVRNAETPNQTTFADSAIKNDSINNQQECIGDFFMIVHCEIGPTGTFILLFLVIIALCVTIFVAVWCCYRHKKYKKKYIVFNAKLSSPRKTSIAV